MERTRPPADGQPDHISLTLEVTDSASKVADGSASQPQWQASWWCRLATLLVQWALVGGYVYLCLYLSFGTTLVAALGDDDFNRSAGRRRFYWACMALVGVLGLIVAAVCAIWALGNAIWQSARPLWRRFLLTLSPMLVHCVFVALPLTVAYVKTAKDTKDE